MVHKCSESALLLRRQRALARGFPRPRLIEVGFQLARTPVVAVSRTRDFVESIGWHDMHDALIGFHSHFARHATRHADVASIERHFHLLSHRRAKHAKHDGLKSRTGWCEDAGDPLWQFDPWAGAAPAVPRASSSSACPVDPWRDFKPVTMFIDIVYNSEAVYIDVAHTTEAPYIDNDGNTKALCMNFVSQTEATCIDFCFQTEAQSTDFCRQTGAQCFEVACQTEAPRFVGSDNTEATCIDIEHTRSNEVLCIDFALTHEAPCSDLDGNPEAPCIDIASDNNHDFDKQHFDSPRQEPPRQVLRQAAQHPAFCGLREVLDCCRSTLELRTSGEQPLMEPLSNILFEFVHTFLAVVQKSNLRKMLLSNASPMRFLGC